MSKYLYNVQLNGTVRLFEEHASDEPYATVKVAAKVRTLLTDANTAENPAVMTVYKGSFSGAPVAVRKMCRCGASTSVYPVRP